MAKKLVIEKEVKLNRIVYIRLTDELQSFIDGVSNKLKTTRSKAIRAVLLAAKGANIQYK